MDFKTLASQRYSLRRYAKKPVEQDKIDSILAVCRLAPTACNNQPQRILVIKTPEGLKKLDGCTGSRFGAPLAMLVCYDVGEAWRRGQDGVSSGEVDAAIVGTHLMMQAQELGLGSCWVMAFDPAAIRQAFHLPDNIEPVALFPLGYPAMLAGPGPLHTKRKKVDKVVQYESFA